MAAFLDGPAAGQGVIKDVLSVSVSQSDAECAKTHTRMSKDAQRPARTQPEVTFNLELRLAHPSLPELPKKDQNGERAQPSRHCAVGISVEGHLTLDSV